MLFGKPKVVDAVSRPGVKFNRFSKMTIGSRLALLFITLLVVVAVAAPVISPEDPLDYRELSVSDRRAPVRHR